MSNPTLFDFFTDPNFIKSTPKFNCIQTAVLRYYLTAQAGKRLKSDRLNQEEINKQIKKLKRIEVNYSFNIDFHLELVKKGGEMYGKTKTQIKPHVSYAKQFFKFVEKSVLITDQKEIINNKNCILRYYEAIMDKSEFVVESKINNKKVILNNNPKEYLAELKNKYPKLSDQELFDKSKLNLDSIFNLVNSFTQYRKVRLISKDKNVKHILRFIGWYKEYYKLTIDELKIEKIIPIIDPYQYRHNLDTLNPKSFSELAIKEAQLNVKIKNKSKEFRKTISIFFDDYLKNSTIETKEIYIQSLINLVCFFYKDITDIEENNNFQDISLIKFLRVCMCDLRKNKQVKEKKTVPFVWKEIEAVCERLRKEANQNHQCKKTNKNNIGTKLTKRAKALHLQDFLAIAFFVVMPPDRQRTFRELTFGETLKYGIRDPKCNTFISHYKLDSTQEPKYYIHLKPHQYKTGNTYGTYWHEIPNVKYKDGKKFYDYLNQWLFEGYRDELATFSGETNAVFIASTTGIAYRDDNSVWSANRYGSFIKHIFSRKTKFPLNPHALRDIYVTHINNLGLDQTQRKAIAYMMHHDIDTADKIYNKQTIDEKIAPALKFF